MGRMKFGVHIALEEEANAILARSMAGITRQADKSDVLTPWKEQNRRRREVYVASGTPDPAVRQGMYNRRSNPSMPHLNSRDGFFQAPRRGSDQPARSSLAEFVAQNLLES